MLPEPEFEDFLHGSANSPSLVEGKVIVSSSLDSFGLSLPVAQVLSTSGSPPPPKAEIFLAHSEAVWVYGIPKIFFFFLKFAKMAYMLDYCNLYNDA
jgi:hypothetical protein